MTARWRRSLGGQVVSLMLVALIIGQSIGFALSWSSRKHALKEAAQSEFVSRTATLSKVVTGMPDDLRRDVLLASATTYTRFWTSDTDPKAQGRDWYVGSRAYLLEPLSDIIHYRSTPESLSLDKDQAAFIQTKPFLGWSPLKSPLWIYETPASVLPFENQIGLGIVVQLTDGTWLNAVFYKRHLSDTGLMQSLMTTLITGVALCLIGFFAAQRIARPLRILTTSAESLGRGETIPALPDSGPDDIRNLQMAFNTMQDRLHRFVDDRTRMLAAIGHDLRTPLTTLRLRVEFIQDAELRRKMTATLDEMHRMTEATLTLAKGEATTEPTRNVELSALLESLCDDLGELGFDVTYVDTGKSGFRCRPDALRRAVRNLVENAVRYAGSAAVTLKASERAVEILVEDHGPGIPEAESERVFSPFYRLEQSRNLETGGVGLGLSIARAIAKQHGGDVVLSANNPGLRAAIVLPRG